MSAKEHTKRWAIAPPPPESRADASVSGEFTLSLESDLLDPDSGFMAKQSSPMRSGVVHKQVMPTISPEEIEPSDSDRPTEAPGISTEALGFDREFPTIPAPTWTDSELARRPAPSVATGRGFFLESLARDEAAPESVRPTIPSLDLDSDDSL